MHVERGDVVREINTSCPVAVAEGSHGYDNLEAFRRVDALTIRGARIERALMRPSFSCTYL
jgi:hypothetical protein